MNLRLCQRLIEACCSQLLIKKIIPNTEGWVYFVAEINDEYIFRFPLSAAAEKDLEIEIALLPQLSEWVPLPIPQFSFICKGNKEYPRPFVGYPKIPGIPLRKPLLEASKPHKPAQQLGSFLTKLHNYSTEKALQTKLPYFSADQWRTDYHSFYQRVKKKIFPVLNNTLRREITKTWKTFLANDQHFKFQPTLIHRDLGDDHILWDHVHKYITGIIDWNDVCIGDPAFDFTGLLGCYGNSFTEITRTYYKRPLDTTFFDRPRFYNRISLCHTALYAQMIDDQELLQESIKLLQEQFFEETD